MTLHDPVDPATHGCMARQARQTGVAWAIAALIGLVACGGGGGGTTIEVAPSPAEADVDKADIRVLMMGNSHTAANALPQQLGDLLRAQAPGKTVAVVVAPGWMFLDERLTDAPSMALLRSRPWSVVVLQAQKYSSSGLFTYSTLEAQTLISDARIGGAQPVLFPEWPRLGVNETQRIYNLHLSIARLAPACVSPVGQAWDLALQRHPGLVLHDADGNHSAPAGAYLTALMLWASITGASPLGLPALNNGVDATVQQQLRAVAADTAAVLSPRLHCSPA
jgi:hypothetical protein